MPKFKITLTRKVPQTLTVEVEVDEATAAFLSDPANAKQATFWAQQQGNSLGTWRDAPVVDPAVDAKLDPLP